jgi:predicted nucleic acid-binding protein
VAPPADAALAALCRAFALDAGERECFAVLATLDSPLFFTDDAAARLVGTQLGYRVHGTIGLVVRAIRTGQRTREEVLAIFDELPRRSTLYIQRSLLNEVQEKIRRGLS